MNYSSLLVAETEKIPEISSTVDISYGLINKHGASAMMPLKSHIIVSEFERACTDYSIL